LRRGREESLFVEAEVVSDERDRRRLRPDDRRHLEVEREDGRREEERPAAAGEDGDRGEDRLAGAVRGDDLFRSEAGVRGERVPQARRAELRVEREPPGGERRERGGLRGEGTSAGLSLKSSFARTLSGRGSNR
jgi:hypothetical protein